ncbi:MAG: glycosyltransferase family 4 protein, partial [Anaerolineales bacterium]
ALIWGMWNVPRSVPALIEDLLPGRVVYYLCDYWPSLPSAYVQRLKAPSRRGFTQVTKRLISRSLLAMLQNDRPMRLAFDHAVCVSERVREILVHDGVLPSSARVIHGGIRADEFARADGRRSSNARPVLKMIYVGRLEPEKGVHTAIRALALSVRRENGRHATFRIVGRGNRDYETHLRQLVDQLGLEDRVKFDGWHPHSKLPAVMAKHDTLIFPSEWEEPFARTVLEAMAAGLVVIGTRSGGTDEVLVEGVTGLTFQSGDARGLADQIDRLAQDPNLRKRLAEAGKQRVVEEFTFDGMADRLEAALTELIATEVAGAGNGRA